MRQKLMIVVAGLAVLLGVVALTSGCLGGADSDLEVRTFQLEFLKPDAAQRIIDPYVFADRGGMVSLGEQTRTITVRETAEMLSRIEEVLARYDEPEPSVKLQFRLVEADGNVAQDDPRLAEVQQALPRDLFRFENFRLIGETVMTGIEYSQVMQGIAAGGERFTIEGTIDEVRLTETGGSVRLRVALYSAEHGSIFATAVNAQIGQLLVLGSAQPDPKRGAVILAVRVEVV